MKTHYNWVEIEALCKEHGLRKFYYVWETGPHTMVITVLEINKKHQWEDGYLGGCRWRNTHGETTHWIRVPYVDRLRLTDIDKTDRIFINYWHALAWALKWEARK